MCFGLYFKKKENKETQRILVFLKNLKSNVYVICATEWFSDHRNQWDARDCLVESAMVLER